MSFESTQRVSNDKIAVNDEIWIISSEFADLCRVKEFRITNGEVFESIRQIFFNYGVHTLIDLEFEIIDELSSNRLFMIVEDIVTGEIDESIFLQDGNWFRGLDDNPLKFYKLVSF